MRSILLIGLAALILSPIQAQMDRISVVIDTSEALAVLKAVQTPTLTSDEALLIARLPGSQGIIRKAGLAPLPSGYQIFARALVASAHHQAPNPGSDTFDFDLVREEAYRITQVMQQLQDPTVHLLPDIKARIALFTPADLKGTVTGYLVLGSTSYGFAFNGEPATYLNLEHVLSPTLASTILTHELFHAVQMLATLQVRPSAAETACLAASPHAREIRFLLNALEMEGTASYVGDLIALSDKGLDLPTTKERDDFLHIVNQRVPHITQLELSVHGLATDATVSWPEVYAAGFDGDQPFYGIGYTMARALAKQYGNQAIAETLVQSGSQFTLRYVALPSYGNTKDVPALGTETVAWARKIVGCSKHE